MGHICYFMVKSTEYRKLIKKFLINYRLTGRLQQAKNKCYDSFLMSKKRISFTVIQSCCITRYLVFIFLFAFSY
jgi:hypothetical protein